MLDPNPCHLDKHIPDFRRIVELARPIVKEQKRREVRRKPHFTFDTGLVPSLHVVGKFCRDRVIRREAIALLKEMNNVEEAWDSNGLAQMDEQLMEVEEAGVKTEHSKFHSVFLLLLETYLLLDSRVFTPILPMPQQTFLEIY